MAYLGHLAQIDKSARRTSLQTVIICLALMLSGCSTSIKLRVLDAETNEPIEGAVALAAWTEYKGLPGYSYGVIAKVAEPVSDKEGYLTIPGAAGELALQIPSIQIYKVGYVGWHWRYIYLGCREDDRKVPVLKRRENFSWKNQDIYLERWKDEYTYSSHGLFISSPTLKSRKYDEAIRYEIPFWKKESEEFRRSNIKNNM